MMNFNEILSKAIKVLIYQSWWVILLLIVCFVGNDVGTQKYNKTLSELKCKYSDILKDKELASLKKEELKLRIESQSDPAWVERVLIKELGVVPENQVKVYFSK